MKVPYRYLSGKTEENKDKSHQDICCPERDSSDSQQAILNNGISLKTDAFVETF
jgi:hypothetical protein